MLLVHSTGSGKFSFTCGLRLDGLVELSHVVSKLGIVASDEL